MKKNMKCASILALSMVAIFGGISRGDPVPGVPNVFCFRVTDIESSSASTFTFEFEILNWANMNASGLYVAMSVASARVDTGGIPTIIGNSIDPDGRGGPVGGMDIGAGTFNDPSHQSGRGRGDLSVCVEDVNIACTPDGNGRDLTNCPAPPGIFDCQAGEVCIDDPTIVCVTPGNDPVNCPLGPNNGDCQANDVCIDNPTIPCATPGNDPINCPIPPPAFECELLINDWSAVATPSPASAASARLWLAGAGTPIPFQNMLGTAAGDAQYDLVPGLGNDSTGDTAIDGGPAMYTADPPPPPGCPGCATLAIPPDPDGSGNVLDGFTITVTDLDPAENFSINWFLLDSSGMPIGTAGVGNQFGFGVINITRVLPGGGPPPLSQGGFNGTGGANSGYVRGVNFFGTVHTLTGSSDAEFYLEFGPTLTGGFLNANDNIFSAAVNAELIVPAVSEWGVAVMALLVLLGGTIVMRRQRKVAAV